MSENTKLAQAILSHLPYITLSTVTKDGIPWNAPVWAAFNETTTSSGSQQNTLVIPKTSERTLALPLWCMTRLFSQTPEKGSIWRPGHMS